MKILKDRGGLGIKDLEMMNIALGAKFLYRMITSSKKWWKTFLWKKYFRGSRSRCVETPQKIRDDIPF
jgi:hypothetical protein